MILRREGYFAPVLLGALGVSAVLVALLARGLSLETTHPALAVLILSLFAVTTTALALSAIIALAGLRPLCREVPRSETPPGRTAVLWLLCGEPPEPVAARAAEMLRALAARGAVGECDIFILSDTQGDAARAREARAFAPLAGQITYRNRTDPEGRKPGNLEDWLRRWGADYETMLVLDADSGFSVDLLSQMRLQMAARPRLGLLQAAIRLRPARTRFGQVLRLSSRLSGPVFARGLARLSGDAGNYWGHNALIRVRAFAEVTPLRRLSGRPPFGGPVLSHDFVEAAFLRRAGWEVDLLPEARGSFEDAPDTLAGYFRRDHRWSQGNLQHLRFLCAPGLHFASRMHLALGVLSYLTAPLWLALVLLTGSGAVHATVGAIWPLLAVLALLMVPKLAGLAAQRRAFRHRARRKLLLRALWAELALTTLFAPLGMLRRCWFILQTVVGRSVDWVPSGQAAGLVGSPGRPERIAGAAIMLAVALPQALIAGAGAAALASLLVLPVTLPLLAAPRLWKWLEAAPARDAVAEYYDRSTRRFLAMGGSGEALAIHRPLWADGVATRAQAAAHVNDLIARAAEAALPAPPDRVIDLGCGVGGSLFHLAQRWRDSAFCGITLSAEQVCLAQGYARAQGLEERCQFLRSDFTLPTTLPPGDLVIAVESHVHAPSAQAFLRAALRHLRPGGVLVLVDDMLARPHAQISERQKRRLAQFQTGWRLGHVPDHAGLVEAAQQNGFDLVDAQDLTGLLRLDRWRDHALRIAGPLAARAGLAPIPLFSNMIGGNALTESYRAGEMRYRMLVLRRAQSERRVEAVA